MPDPLVLTRPAGDRPKFHNEHYRKLYGKMEMDQLRRLKTLEVENRRLKKVVADQALDMQILKEAVEGKY